MPAAINVTTILNKAKKRDSWFLNDYTINPYSGCSFNCLYCYIRGSQYGEYMEQKTSVKANALPLLEKQLRNRAQKGQYGIIVLSSATDPYLHFEATEQLTRQMLEMILHFRFPVHIITKSSLVARDFDLLQQIDANAILPADLEKVLSHKALLSFSFSCTNDATAAIFEPGATPPSERLATLQAALDAGLHSGVSLMPLLPYITDTAANLEAMFTQFAAIQPNYILPASLTLFGHNPADSKPLMFRAIQQHYPHLLPKYHQFFDNSNQMPPWYLTPFYKKMQVLCQQYGLKDSIL